MPATRLLVLADPKMLPALASGLREGGVFDVLTLPFGDAGAGAAAQRADAVAVFYGAPDSPLQAALQAIAPAVRGRGGRVLAVLQREQAAQRDECFKAGASDLLFMPMPKEQFVARLAESVGLSYVPERGAPAAVQVGARGNLVQLPQATVTPGGVHAAAALPFRPGETVRLSWGSFETWGLVVRASPEAQIRFAGVAPDEEARIREWMRQATAAGAGAAVVPAAPAASRAAPSARPAGAGAAAAAGARPVSPAVPAARPVPVVPAGPSAAAAPRAAAAPASAAGAQPGPPPGFADRRRIKDVTPVRPAPRVPVSGNGARPATIPPAVQRAPQMGAAVPAAPEADDQPDAGLSDLFDDGSSPVAAVPAAELAPMWPEVVAAEACLAAGAAMLRDKKPPSDAEPGMAAAAKKIAGGLSLGERNALEKSGLGSHFADAMAARIALEVARAEATRLFTSQSPALVDDEGVKSLTQLADAAAARLQKEADGAISRGDLESLQLLRASSAALSRDVMALKAAADRLRGVAAAPRLGAGGLDPEVVLPGQAWRPPPKFEPAQVKAELREFQGLGEASPESRRRGVLYVCLLAMAAGIVNVMFFAYPRVTEIPPQIPGVARIELSGDTARVTVGPDFAENQTRSVAMLVETLRERRVEKVMLVRPNGSSAGQISVADGRAYGLPPASKRNDAPLPVVPPQPAPQPAQVAPAPAPQGVPARPASAQKSR